MKTLNYILGIILLNLSAYGQQSIPNQIKRDYNTLSYVKTTEKLLKLTEKGIETKEIAEKLANSYYFNNKMNEATKWYEKLVNNFESKNTTHFYRYAMSLKAIGEYEKADMWFQKFAVENPNDSRAISFINSKDYLDKINNPTELYQITNLDLNTKFSDFGASFYQNGIVFASSRLQKGEMYNWNNQPYLDLYFSDDKTTTTPITGAINTKYHESSTAFTKDGKTMYFTRNNYYNGKAKKSKKNVNGLKIFKATLQDDGSWGEITSLPFNNDNYNVAHPALSPDQTKLYFSSDMDGSIGSSDIFVVDINPDGTYGIPQNLGNTINTEGRENFPFISSDGYLYFSSDGHLGLGGLDIFKTKLDDKEYIITNLGNSINSSKDDFKFIINSENTFGYLTSNRKGGKGDDDIYELKKLNCDILVKGLVTDAKTKKIIANAKVIVYNANNQEVQDITTDTNGAFSYLINNCSKQTFKVVSSKGGFSPNETSFITEKINDIDLNISLNAIEKPAFVGTEITKLLDLKPIYFDFNKSDIREDAEFELNKVYDYMMQYPAIKIDVQSHTDSRASDKYNLILSQKRNKATLDYLIKKGINPNRLSGKGYGETQLKNKCSNGVDCSEFEHQENRRSEFYIAKN